MEIKLVADLATPSALAHVALAHLTPMQATEVARVALRYPGRYAALINHRLGGRVFEASVLARELLCIARTCLRGGDA